MTSIHCCIHALAGSDVSTAVVCLLTCSAVTPKSQYFANVAGLKGVPDSAIAEWERAPLPFWLCWALGPPVQRNLPPIPPASQWGEFLEALIPVDLSGTISSHQRGYNDIRLQKGRDQKFGFSFHIFLTIFSPFHIFPPGQWVTYNDITNGASLNDSFSNKKSPQCHTLLNSRHRKG